MNDSAAGAVPEAGAGGARPPAANVPAGTGERSVSRPGTNRPSGLVLFRNAETGSAGELPPRLERIFVYGSQAALAACLFGFAWAASSYFSGDHSLLSSLNPPPMKTIVTQDSAERREMLHATQKMAEDLRSLKASVEVLRTAQNQMATETARLENLKTRLDAVKTETSASIAGLADKIERVQREPEAKLPQIIERLDRIEHQSAAPIAAGTAGAVPASAAAAPRKQAHGGRGDAFDPTQNPNAPGAPRPLGSVAPAANMNPSGGRLPPFEPANGPRNPQLITNWVVRDVYDGIALVESPRGSIEVTPGEIIPGAGTVKSIERRGAGWIVITSRGLVDSARDNFQP
jgi:TolA-binding protein